MTTGVPGRFLHEGGPRAGPQGAPPLRGREMRGTHGRGSRWSPSRSSRGRCALGEVASETAGADSEEEGPSLRGPRRSGQRGARDGTLTMALPSVTAVADPGNSAPWASEDRGFAGEGRGGCREEIQRWRERILVSPPGSSCAGGGPGRMHFSGETEQHTPEDTPEALRAPSP